MRFYFVITIIIVALICQGCFSEVESTPKISYKPSSNHDDNHKESLISNISNVPFKNWAQGKLFHVTDNKACLAFHSNNNIDSLCGTTLTYIGYKVNPSITGSSSTNLYFTTNDGDSISYHINASHEELIKRNNLEIPFLVQQSLIDDINNKLSNKNLFILSQAWYNIDGKQASGKKFVPITIIKVEVGNAIYPIKVIFSDDEKNTFFTYMTIGNEFQTTRNFETIFSTYNPHDNYPHIDKDTWKLITIGMIKIGMTQEECQLSIGNPANVIIEETSSPEIIKRWEYDNGYILYFENGILKEYKQ